MSRRLAAVPDVPRRGVALIRVSKVRGSGITVSLSSDAAMASVTVAPGAGTAAFNVATSPVTTSWPVLLRQRR